MRASIGGWVANQSCQLPAIIIDCAAVARPVREAPTREHAAFQTIIADLGTTQEIGDQRDEARLDEVTAHHLYD